jgi:hypothetical protein
MPVDLTVLQRHASAAIAHLPQTVTLNGVAVPCAESRLRSQELAQREQEFVDEYATSLAVVTAEMPVDWAIDKRAVYREKTWRILMFEHAPDGITTLIHLANLATARMA